MSSIYDEALKELSKALIDESFKRLDGLAKQASSGAKALYDKFEILTKRRFVEYLKLSAIRYGYTRNIISRHDPIPIESVYIPMDIRFGKGRIVDSRSYLQLFSHSKHICMTGTAGIGKSTTIRDVFLQIIKAKRQIPVLFELRLLNDSEIGLLASISLQIGLDDDKGASLKYAMEHGLIVLLLDGFDEVYPQFRKGTRKEVLEIAKDFPDTPIMVTSRPDDVEFSGWTMFSQMSVLPLTKSKAVALVKKMTFFEENLRVEFANDLEHHLYDMHSSVLSIPLLVTIMLILYEEYRNVPSQMHVFYERVYDALYFRHDKTKEGYVRSTMSGLAEKDFRHLVNAFCYVSYAQGKLKFEHSTFQAIVETACKLTNLKVSSVSFLADLQQHICLLVNDGLSYSFTHRTFQEYYAASYIADVDEADLRLVFKVVDLTSYSDVVVKLLAGIKRGIVDKYFVGPELQRWLSKIKYDGTITDDVFESYVVSLNLWFDQRTRKLEIRGGGVATLLMSFLMDNYPSFVVKNSDNEPTEWLKDASGRLPIELLLDSGPNPGTRSNPQGGIPISRDLLQGNSELLSVLKRSSVFGVQSLTEVIELHNSIRDAALQRHDALNTLLIRRTNYTAN